MTTPGKRRAVFPWSLVLKWAAVAAALGVSAVGILLLWGVWDGRPVAAAFTRVGGPTRVETALQASRFWLTPPQYVVETQTNAGQIMLGAARCAVVHDAPLLFTSSDPKRQRRVNTKIKNWRKIETPKSVARPEISTIRSQHDLWQPIETTLPKVISIQNQGEVRSCLGKRHLADIARLSTLKTPNPLIRLPQVPAQKTLATVVVFAAAIQPGHPPDVAVGLALAAHIARSNREDVSLVVVPNYLESDPELEGKLQGQHELVTGGVVLGQTPTVPEDTRALLRQLLTSTDRQGVLAQVQDNLGSAGSLIAALLALTGVATAARIAGPIVIERLERNEQTKRTQLLVATNVPIPIKERSMFWRKVRRLLRAGGGQDVTAEEAVPVKKSDWLIGLGDNQEVTVRLRSGREVTGTVESQIPDDTRDATVFRIKNTRREREDRAGQTHLHLTPSQHDPPPKPNVAYVLVSVKDIELIEINVRPEEAAGTRESAG